MIMRLGVIVNKMCNLHKHDRALWSISYCVVYYCFTLISGLDVAAHYKPTSRHNCWQRTHSLTLSLSLWDALVSYGLFPITAALSFNMLKCNSIQMLFLYSFYALTSVYTSSHFVFTSCPHARRLVPRHCLPINFSRFDRLPRQPVPAATHQQVTCVCTVFVGLWD